MTGCPAQSTFDLHPREPAVAGFCGGPISPDAGLLPVRQLGRRLGWPAAVAEVLDNILGPESGLSTA